jgi:hypothetical protein
MVFEGWKAHYQVCFDVVLSLMVAENWNSRISCPSKILLASLKRSLMPPHFHMEE